MVGRFLERFPDALEVLQRRDRQRFRMSVPIAQEEQSFPVGRVNLSLLRSTVWLVGATRTNVGWPGPGGERDLYLVPRHAAK